MVLKDKVADLIDRYLSCSAASIQDIYDYIRKRKKAEKKGLVEMKNSMKKGI